MEHLMLFIFIILLCGVCIFFMFKQYIKGVKEGKKEMLKELFDEELISVNTFNKKGLEL